MGGGVLEVWYRPDWGCFVPEMIVFPLLVMMTEFLLKVAMHPASHSLPIDMRELCAKPGKMWASFSLS